MVLARSQLQLPALCTDSHDANANANAISGLMSCTAVPRVDQLCPSIHGCMFGSHQMPAHLRIGEPRYPSSSPSGTRLLINNGVSVNLWASTMPPPDTKYVFPLPTCESVAVSDASLRVSKRLPPFTRLRAPLTATQRPAQFKDQC